MGVKISYLNSNGEMIKIIDWIKLSQFKFLNGDVIRIKSLIKLKLFFSISEIHCEGCFFVSGVHLYVSTSRPITNANNHKRKP